MYIRNFCRTWKYLKNVFWRFIKGIKTSQEKGKLKKCLFALAFNFLNLLFIKLGHFPPYSFYFSLSLYFPVSKEMSLCTYLHVIRVLPSLLARQPMCICVSAYVYVKYFICVTLLPIKRRNLNPEFQPMQFFFLDTWL